VLCSNLQFNILLCVLCAVGGVNGKTAITHIHRHSLCGNMLEAGVPAMDLKLYQRWAEGSAMGHYEASSFKPSVMLPAAGWADIDSFHCWWESNGTAIAALLLELVFIGLDEVADLAAEVDALFPNVDSSAVRFCNLLRHLRKVFLEDAAVLAHKYPLFPAYRIHPVLKLPVFALYAAEERGRTEIRYRQWLQKDSQLQQQVEALREDTQTAAAEHNKLLQDLRQDFQQFAAAVATSSISAAAESPEEEACAVVPSNNSFLGSIPPPPDSITDMAAFYVDWRHCIKQQYEAHKKENGSLQWSKLFGEKQGKLYCQRFSHISSWLQFLDSLSTDRAAAALAVMTTFAEKHQLKHSPLIKKVFGKVAKPELVVGGKYDLSEQLRADLVLAGFGVELPSKQKQDHSARKRKAC
jgi:hypothetical protein